MFHLLVLLVITTVCPLVHGEESGRIVGGVEVTIEEFPFQVSLRNTDFWHFCGGIVISPLTVLTAAHCVNKLQPRQVIIEAGSATLSPSVVTRRVNRILVHPFYNTATHNWDGALLFLNSPLVIGPNIQPVVLASVEPVAGTNATVTGWGTDSEGGSITNQLMAVSVPIVDRATCNINYAPITVTTIMICAGSPDGGKDSCETDDGGPLVSNDRQLVGIVSWGVGCGRPRKPGVYTNVARLRAWIVANVL